MVNCQYYVAKLETLCTTYSTVLASVGGTAPSMPSNSDLSSSRPLSMTTSASPSPTTPNGSVRQSVVQTRASPKNSMTASRQSTVSVRSSIGAPSNLVHVASGYDASAGGAPSPAAATPAPAPDLTLVPAPAPAQPMCRVLYDFTGVNEGELTVKEGMVVPLISQDDPDWTTVEVDGVLGYVPATYVEKA